MTKVQVHTQTVLIAEDDEDDFFLLRRTLGAHYPDADLKRVYHGEELLEYLRTQERPALIILDLNMPRSDGREALREIKKDAVLRDIPVAVLTTSGSHFDREFVLENGGLFFTKPYEMVHYSLLMKLLQKYF